MSMSMSGPTVTFAVQVSDEPALYTTDDVSRLHAVTFGLLVGAGLPGNEAHLKANDLTRAVTRLRQNQTETLKDGRTLLLYVWK